MTELNIPDLKPITSSLATWVDNTDPALSAENLNKVNEHILTGFKHINLLIDAQKLSTEYVNNLTLDHIQDVSILEGVHQIAFNGYKNELMQSEKDAQEKGDKLEASNTLGYNVLNSRIVLNNRMSNDINSTFIPLKGEPILVYPSNPDDPNDVMGIKFGDGTHPLSQLDPFTGKRGKTPYFLRPNTTIITNWENTGDHNPFSEVIITEKEYMAEETHTYPEGYSQHLDTRYDVQLDLKIPAPYAPKINTEINVTTIAPVNNIVQNATASFSQDGGYQNSDRKLSLGIPSGANGLTPKFITTYATTNYGTNPNVEISPSGTKSTTEFDVNMSVTLPANATFTIGSVTKVDPKNSTTHGDAKVSLGTPTGTYNNQIPINFEIPTGLVGTTPKLSIGTITKLDYNDNPTATITLTNDNKDATLNLGIPVGYPASLQKASAKRLSHNETPTATVQHNYSEPYMYDIEFGIPDGYTPNINVGTVSTLEVDDNNNVQKAIVEKVNTTGDDVTFNFSIPAGKTGNDGISITDVIQIAESTEDAGINTFQINFSNGTSTTFSIRNGSRGPQGQSGVIEWIEF